MNDTKTNWSKYIDISLENQEAVVGGYLLKSQQHARVSQGRSCYDSCMDCHTVTEAAIKPATSPNRRTLTPGQPFPALTPKCQVPGRVATGTLILKSLVWLNLEKAPLGKGDLIPGMPLSWPTPYDSATKAVVRTRFLEHRYMSFALTRLM